MKQNKGVYYNGLKIDLLHEKNKVIQKHLVSIFRNAAYY